MTTKQRHSFKDKLTYMSQSKFNVLLVHPDSEELQEPQEMQRCPSADNDYSAAAAQSQSRYYFTFEA